MHLLARGQLSVRPRCAGDRAVGTQFRGGVSLMRSVFPEKLVPHDCTSRSPHAMAVVARVCEEKQLAPSVVH